MFFFAFSWAKARTPSFSGKSSSTSKEPEKTWGTDFFGYRFVWEKTRFASRTPSFLSGFSWFYRTVKPGKTWGAENLWVPMFLTERGASMWRPRLFYAKISVESDAGQRISHGCLRPRISVGETEDLVVKIDNLGNGNRS